MNVNGYRVKNLAKTGIVNVVRYLFLLALGFVFIYPFIFMLANSVKGYMDFRDPTVQWIPKAFNLNNFSLAVRALEMPTSLVITLFYQVTAGMIQVLSCAVAAYSISRFHFRGKRILTFLMVLQIFIPVAMTAIPSYAGFRYLDVFGILGQISNWVGVELRPNLLDTPLVYWLPSLLGVGFKGGFIIYIYKQFFLSLPKELEEAAWVDGAGPWKTFVRIVFPCSGAAVLTVSLFSVIWNWNETFLASIYLEKQPLSVVFSQLGQRGSLAVDKLMANNPFNETAVIMAACLIFIIPLLAFYLVLQKRFVASIATSGIVG